MALNYQYNVVRETSFEVTYITVRGSLIRSIKISAL